MRVYAAQRHRPGAPDQRGLLLRPQVRASNSAAVADGMGGHQRGRSGQRHGRAACSKRRCATSHRSPRGRGCAAPWTAANADIYRKGLAAQREGCPGMGTTITALLHGRRRWPTSPRWATADAYLIRGNRAILQVTTDHTLVEEMVLKRRASPRSEARNHPQRNLHHPGPGHRRARWRWIFCAFACRRDDVFLLCTRRTSTGPSFGPGDRSKSCSVRACACAKTSSPGPGGAAPWTAGGHDNITVLIVT